MSRTGAQESGLALARRRALPPGGGLAQLRAPVEPVPRLAGALPGGDIAADGLLQVHVLTRLAQPPHEPGPLTQERFVAHLDHGRRAALAGRQEACCDEGVHALVAQT